jgi:hypothetical protein
VAGLSVDFNFGAQFFAARQERPLSDRTGRTRGPFATGTGTVEDHRSTMKTKRIFYGSLAAFAAAAVAFDATGKLNDYPFSVSPSTAAISSHTTSRSSRFLAARRFLVFLPSRTEKNK